MSITVKEIKVRPNDLKKEITANFNDLKEFAQKRMLKEHVDLFFEDALVSEYPSVKKLAMELMEECYSTTLNKVIRKELKKARGVSCFENYDSELVFKILNCKKLCLDEDLRKRLSKTEIWKIRNWIAQDKKTSNEILNDMLFAESRNFMLHKWVVIFDSIVQNPNFELKEKTKDAIYYYYTGKAYTTIMGRIETMRNKKD